KIEGSDALSFIQKVATNDVSKLSENQCQYSILCNEQGGTIDDILVYRLPANYLIVCNACNTNKVLNWLKSQVKSFSQVEISLSENLCMLSVQGSMSNVVVGKVFNVDLTSLKRNHVAWLGESMISRTGYTGEDGLELIVKKSDAPKVWETLIKAGAKPCGLGARDTLRLEAGLPLYGHEYDEETSPLEVGYSWAVKFDKGDFIGRAALLQEKEKGLKKKLVGLELDSRAIAREGSKIFANLAPAGKVTSGTFSPTLKKPIALAMLSDLDKTDLLVEVRGQKLAAKVVAKNFYKR
ncbi:MAG: glycine cleavage system aminomethyltransferase GcvT, partial [Candidatus Margulisbacteria bacterium]|nr:glycine cleavage system aminomethyltransferase GcvT [Candidatus Margulisiibacteriota bacterium]